MEHANANNAGVEQKPTFGQWKVGIDFNPSGNKEVNAIKQLAANYIDRIKSIQDASEDPEVKRLCAVAITDAEGSAMWAVKAATKKPFPVEEKKQENTTASAHQAPDTAEGSSENNAEGK